VLTALAQARDTRIRLTAGSADRHAHRVWNRFV
jgi:hypothetical protein